MRTDLAPDVFAAQIAAIGCAIAAQSERLVPADKRLYALRDRTGSVPSIGLIAASIVSKKIAGGARAIVFDVKVGGGAFMRERADAVALATTMVRLAARSGRRASAIVTDMDEPLATLIGTGLEAIEARDFLRGGRPADRFTTLTAVVAGEMLRVGGVPEAEITPRLDAALRDGSAYARFIALVEAQGGDRGALEALAPAAVQVPVRAERAGYVSAIDAVAIGEAARDLVGAYGPFAGVRIRQRVGAAVAHGEPLASVIGSDAAADAARIGAAFSIDSEPPLARDLVAAVIRDASVVHSSNGSRP
jgi:thymidine phosphorylase